MSEIAKELGFEAIPVEADVSLLRSITLPAILHWKSEHFVVLVGIRSDRFILHDPARGQVTLPADLLARRYSNKALVMQPLPTFRRLSRDYKGFQWLVFLLRLPGIRAFALQLIALSLVLQAILIVTPLLTQLMLDHAVPLESVGLLISLAVGFAGLLIIQLGSGAVRSLTVIHLRNALALQLNKRLFGHLLRLPVEYFEQRHIGDVTSRFSSLAALQRTLTGGFIESIVDGVMVIATLIVMIVYDARLALVAVAATGIYLLARRWMFSPLRVAAQEQMEHEARQHSSFLESVRGIESIKTLAATESRARHWNARLERNLDATARGERWNVLFSCVNGFIVGLDGILITTIAIAFVIEGSFTVGMLFAFLSYKAQFSRRATGLIDRVLELRTVAIHVDRVADIALAEPEISALPPPGPPSPEALQAVRLSVKDVSYHYDPAIPVLQSLSLTARDSEMLVIAGPSGSGKTTLLKVILGLYKPKAGELRLNGMEVWGGGIEKYRHLTASVMQNDHLFNGTILMNITFFEENPNLEFARKCTIISGVLDEIESLPRGFESEVGDDGLALSGGQRQRLLLARALYRKPKLLVLDECTSHLDSEMEKSVLQRIKNLRITTILATHSEQAVTLADQVFNMGHRSLR